MSDWSLNGEKDIASMSNQELAKALTKEQALDIMNRSLLALYSTGHTNFGIQGTSEKTGESIHVEVAMIDKNETDF